MTMTIVDNQIKTKNGETFDLHYRGLKNDTYSGFLRNSMWPKNCSIAIPKTHGKANFQAIVDQVIDNDEIKDVLDQLRRQKFEYQADFLGFCNDLIDATQDTLIASYNKYMKNLFGTHKSLMRHTKEGKESFTYYVYVPKDADLATKKMYESQGRQGIPQNCNIKVVELSLFEENIIVNAEFAKKKQEKLEAVRKYFADHKRKAAKKAA